MLAETGGIGDLAASGTDGGDGGADGAGGAAGEAGELCVGDSGHGGESEGGLSEHLDGGAKSECVGVRVDEA